MEDKVMKKVIRRKYNYCGKPARIVCKITDKDGYISITGEVTPYRCRTPHLCGCIHGEIAKAFPKIEKYLWLHLVNLDGSVMYEAENTLYHLINDNVNAARLTLGCATEEELRELDALATYGIHKTRHKSFKGSDWFTADNDGKELFKKAVDKLNLKSRRLAAISDFCEFLEKYN